MDVGVYRSPRPLPRSSASASRPAAPLVPERGSAGEAAGGVFPGDGTGTLRPERAGAGVGFPREVRAWGGRWALPAPRSLSVSARPLRAVAGGCGALAGPLPLGPSRRPSLRASPRCVRRCRGVSVAAGGPRGPATHGLRSWAFREGGGGARGLRARCSGPSPGPGLSLRPVAPALRTALASRGRSGFLGPSA